MSVTLPTHPTATLPALISHVLFTPDQLATRVREIGEQITQDYAAVGNNLVVFGVLKGVLPFQADLLRAIDLPLRADVMAIAGYKPTEAGPLERRPPGVVRITKDLDLSVTGRHVLVVEDMVDTGLTLNFILKLIHQRQPASLAVATLFNREATRLATGLPVRYIGFEAPAEFLVGYGLDFREHFRNLPYVGVLKPEVYAT